MKRPAILVGCGLVLALLFAMEAIPQVKVEEAPLKYEQAKPTDGKTLYGELCAACHGTGAKGDGPAAPAIEMPVPDLTVLTATNHGVFPQAEVRKAIDGDRRIIAHGTIGMPIWGKALTEVRPDWNRVRREAFADSRIDLLVDYLETIQVE